MAYHVSIRLSFQKLVPNHGKRLCDNQQQMIYTGSNSVTQMNVPIGKGYILMCFAETHVLELSAVLTSLLFWQSEAIKFPSIMDT